MAQTQYKDDLLSAVAKAKESIGEEGAATLEDAPVTIYAEMEEAEGPSTLTTFLHTQPAHRDYR